MSPRDNVHGFRATGTVIKCLPGYCCRSSTAVAPPLSPRQRNTRAEPSRWSSSIATRIIYTRRHDYRRAAAITIVFTGHNARHIFRMNISKSPVRDDDNSYAPRPWFSVEITQLSQQHWLSNVQNTRDKSSRQMHRLPERAVEFYGTTDRVPNTNG